MIDANSIVIGTVIGITVGAGGFVLGRIVLKGLGVNGKKNNPNSKFTKEMHDTLCTSRLETVKTIIEGMETNINTKLDFITDSIDDIKKHNENRRKEFRL